MTDAGIVIGRVAELWRYPVKSFRGEPVTAAELDGAGIPGDRRFALRDLESGKILSAKLPSIGTRLLECAATLDTDGHVSITAGTTTVRTDDRDAVDAVLGAYLGRRVHLESSVTPGDAYESYWPEVDGLALSDVTLDFPIAMSTGKSSFVDLAALQMVATSSLATLARSIPGSTVSTARFRPGVVVDTTDTSPAPDGFVENGWVDRPATIGAAQIAFSGASPRCIMTTLAQDDLPRDPAVLRALATHNRVAMEGVGNFACLGIYAEVTAPGRVRVGDPIILC
ncbi:MAG: MOSC domain-containing protein [Acidimicrobiia bacterium]